ncbi:transcriptional regulator BetI [uncultured Shimia sp.]|uniref:choline-binding transcriptional repressor BetI n=1 Tax=uncultured Shimia sp. TaxID=573152 RepID=UPI0026132AE1|nr:transcriptional regulator BetI [uncultured Shimia sp.]
MSRQRIRDIRHDELIDATIKAVHKHGYAAVTMTEIAREAGATAASINYYFGSKERLLGATMQHLLSLLRAAVLRRVAMAATPHERLMALLEANFDDSVYTTEQCSLWVQFWGSAPYVKSLARLHNINRQRVTSNFRAELRALLPEDRRETVREALQSYMDGVWLEATHSSQPLDAAAARDEARRVAQLLLDSEV